ncbi:hypothetical protein [Bradyrhizobium liaoningense]
MDLILRFTPQSSLPNAKGSIISPERNSGGEGSCFVAWATSEAQMSIKSPFEGSPVTLVTASERATSCLSTDRMWELLPVDARQLVENSEESVQILIESGNPGIDFLGWEALASANLNKAGIKVARLVPLSVRPPPLTVVPPLRLC